MNRQVLKTIVFGALLGAALFAAPFFVLKVLAVFLIIGFLFRVFAGRRYYHRRGWRGPWGWAYADKIRGMSDQEYEEFKEKFQGRCWPVDSAGTDKNEGEIQNA